jgi:hypothetical protein
MIDQLADELCGLIPEEIKIIEDSWKDSNN